MFMAGLFMMSVVRYLFVVRCYIMVVAILVVCCLLFAVDCGGC